MSKLRVGTVTILDGAETSLGLPIKLNALANALGNGNVPQSASSRIQIGTYVVGFDGIINMGLSKVFCGLGFMLVHSDRGDFHIVTYASGDLLDNTSGSPLSSNNYKIYARYAINDEKKEYVVSFYQRNTVEDAIYIGDVALVLVNGNYTIFGGQRGQQWNSGEAKRVFTSVFKCNPLSARLENNYVELIDFLFREGETYMKADNLKMNILSDKSEVPKVIQDTNTNSEYAIVPTTGYGIAKIDFALKG